MKRERKPGLLTLAVIACALAACDDGTEPGTFGDLDPGAVAAAVDAVLAPVDASIGPNFLLSDFMHAVLGATPGSNAPAPLDRIRTAASAVPGGAAALALADARSASADVDIATEIRGSTFVWDPAEESWVADPARTGAPSQGLRVIWYATDDFGDFLLPLEELGYIDLTEEDTEDLDRFGVLIVRTDGGTATLADYVYGYAFSENATGWTETAELAGAFSDGTDVVDVEVALQSTGDPASADEAYASTILADGPEGSYEWVLDGAYDAATDIADDDYVVTVHQGGAATVLDLHTTIDADGGIDGTGTLAHDGATVADIVITDSDFAFSRPGGGSFSAGHTTDLEQLVFVLFFYGPILLFALPFILF